MSGREMIHSQTLASAASSPWKNGGGTTRELLAWPSADDWFIRVSVADVERDGPFSAFPDVERHFAVLEGEGVELESVGAIRRTDAPVAFDGAETRNCRLLAGATRDLNVMIRRDRGRGFLQRLDSGGDTVVARGCTLHGIYDAAKETLYWCEGEIGLSPNIRSAKNGRCFHFAFQQHKASQDE
jgi:uncharacterized protein